MQMSSVELTPTQSAEREAEMLGARHSDVAPRTGHKSRQVSNIGC